MEPQQQIPKEVTKADYRRQNMEKARLKRLETTRKKKETEDYQRLLELQKKRLAEFEALQPKRNVSQPIDIPKAGRKTIAYDSALATRQGSDDSSSDSDSSEEIVYVKPKSKKNVSKVPKEPVARLAVGFSNPPLPADKSGTNGQLPNHSLELEAMRRELEELKKSQKGGGSVSLATEVVKTHEPVKVEERPPPSKEPYTDDKEYLQRLMKYKILAMANV